MEEFYRKRPKRDCAMYRCESLGEYCAGLNNMECYWDECKFYKPKSELDYQKTLEDIDMYKGKE